MRNMEIFVVEEAMIAIDFVRSFKSRFLFLSTNVTWQIWGFRSVAGVGSPATGSKNTVLGCPFHQPLR
jgi:hypothetical protein